jgi:hypothetical protein
MIPSIDSQSRILTKRQYIEYLIATCKNYTCTNLSDHLDGNAATSHDAISDYLRRDKLAPRQLWELVAPLIDDGEDSYLVLDDSVQNKQYSKYIELVRLQYSGAEHGLVRGIDIVNLVHTNGKEGGYYPIDYRIYDPDSDGKTENDHFREMVIRAIHDKLIKAKTILFDSWYSSAENLKLIHRMGLFFVTTLKSNRLVSPVKGEGNIHLEQIEWTDDDLANGILVHIKAVPFLVRLFKIVATNGDVEWMITNKETIEASNGDHPSPITAQDVQKENAVRWQVEQMHRELKQLVGTEKCQCRKARSQRNHMAFCYQAWLAIKVAAKKKSVTLYEAQANLFRGYLRAQLRSPGIPAYAA